MLIIIREGLDELIEHVGNRLDLLQGEPISALADVLKYPDVVYRKNRGELLLTLCDFLDDGWNINMVHDHMSKTLTCGKVTKGINQLVNHLKVLRHVLQVELEHIQK